MKVRIGLEVHVPLATRAKLFCPCPADPPEEPNRALCPTCTGQPGARPQGVNAQAVALGLATTRLLGCTLTQAPVFQRKHYVYPDLPNNYQRTSTPLGAAGRFWDVGITEAHLEEDPGAFDPKARHVDLNRSGTPLVEIVTEPDLDDPEDVATWLRVLRLTLERAGILREGAELKADVNVSVHGGDRVEVKNVVGGRNAAKAAAFEVDRQAKAAEAGETIVQETRHFDETKGTTHAMRRKETVGDYRYMPDPDLRPLDVAAHDPGQLDGPGIPETVRELTDELGLEMGEALAVLEDEALEALFDRLRATISEERAVDIAVQRLRSELDYRDTRLSELDVEADLLVELAEAWDREQITKQVFTRLLRDALDGKPVRDALDEERATEVELDGIVEEVIEAHPEVVEKVLDGKDGAINFLVGQVMAKTQGRADAREARELLEGRLAG